jgi:hypothetical protein
MRCVKGICAANKDEIDRDVSKLIIEKSALRSENDKYLERT